MEYIKDKDHLHMNSTTWHTLTAFVQYLGKEGKCKVDHTEKGWFIQYIDRGPDTIQAEIEKAKKEKMETTDEEKQAKFLERQIKLAKASKGQEEEETEYTELIRDNEEEKVRELDAVIMVSGNCNSEARMTRKKVLAMIALSTSIWHSRWLSTSRQARAKLEPPKSRPQRPPIHCSPRQPVPNGRVKAKRGQFR